MNLSEVDCLPADKPRYNYFIPPSLMQAMLSINYFALKFAVSDKGGIILK